MTWMSGRGWSYAVDNFDDVKVGYFCLRIKPPAVFCNERPGLELRGGQL